MNKNYKEVLGNIRAFVFDVDGVLTDGKVVIKNNGEQLRQMNTRDGYAITTAISKGYKVAIITGGNNTGVQKRLEYLGIVDIYMSSFNKLKDYKDFSKKHKIKNEDILYMGDDIPDLEVMKTAGLSSCPSDAVSEIKQIAHYISPKLGGLGCVRDVIEQTLKIQEKWI